MVRVGPVVVSIVLMLAAIPAAAQEDPNARAADLAEEASARFEAGDLDGAIDHFQSAMSYVRDPAFAFNIAYIYQELGVLYPAYRHYGIYLELYPGAPNRDAVRQTMDELEAGFVTDYARLEVSCSPAGSEIWVTTGDRTELYGIAPLQAYVPPGEVIIEGRRDGYEPAERRMNAVAGVRLEVDLGALSPAAAEPRSLSPVVGWTVLGTGLVVATVGVVFWGMADGSATDFNERVARIGQPGESFELSTLQGLRQDALDQSKLGNIVFGVGAGVTATGLVLLLVATLSGGDADSSATTALPSVAINRGSLTFSWSGTF